MPDPLPWWGQILFLVFALTVATTRTWYENTQKKEMMNRFYGKHAQPPEDLGYFPPT